MVVFNAIASNPDEIECTDDSSARNNFHGTSVLQSDLTIGWEKQREIKLIDFNVGAGRRSRADDCNDDSGATQKVESLPIPVEPPMIVNENGIHFKSLSYRFSTPSLNVYVK